MLILVDWLMLILSLPAGCFPHAEGRRIERGISTLHPLCEAEPREGARQSGGGGGGGGRGDDSGDGGGAGGAAAGAGAGAGGGVRMVHDGQQIGTKSFEGVCLC